MKPATHKTITRLAIELCTDRLSLDMQEMINQDSVVQGSADEDTKNLVQRATNWHFYRASEVIPKKKRLLFKPTSEDILKIRITEITNTPEKYNQLGRILHHIQDMSTPSHVLPIYHGPKFPLMFSYRVIEDYFETFMYEHDDKILKNNITELPAIDGIEGFFNIYDNAAKEMLQILKGGFKIDNNVDSATLPFSLFWKSYLEEEYNKIKGFGMYGEYHTYFKRDGLLKDNPYSITEHTLLNIQSTITDHAILNTCKALLYAIENDYV